MGYINSKRYDGIQLYHKKNKDISYYIRYKNEYGKSVRIKVGDKSKGITEPFCKQKRDELINKLRLGEELPLKHKKEQIITISYLSELYFNDKDLDVTQNKRQKSKYDTYIEPIFGNTNIKLLKKNDITEFRNKILKEGKANNTVNGIVILLNAIINYVIGGKDFKYPTTTLQRKLKIILDKNFNKGLDSKDAKNRVFIYTLRHTFASHLAINGTPIFTVQKLMNHRTIEMTLRYAKLMPDSGKEFVNGLYS